MARTRKQTDVIADIVAGKNIRPAPLAAHNGVSDTVIYGMIHREEVEAVRLGRSYAILNSSARRLVGLPPADQRAA